MKVMSCEANTDILLHIVNLQLLNLDILFDYCFTDCSVKLYAWCLEV